MEMIHQQKLDHIFVLAGGAIYPEDIPMLRALEIKGVFLPGSSLEDIVQCINENVRDR